MFNLHSEDYAVFMINLYNVCSISYLFIVVFVLLLVICYYFITDCLLILSELGFFSFLFIYFRLVLFFFVILALVTRIMKILWYQKFSYHKNLIKSKNNYIVVYIVIVK